jgi:hypothetical protein
MSPYRARTILSERRWPVVRLAITYFAAFSATPVLTAISPTGGVHPIINLPGGGLPMFAIPRTATK